MTYDEKHIANTIAYAKKLETAFLKVADQCAAMVNDPSAKFGKSFAFKDRYALAKPAKVIFDNLKGTIESIIISGNATEWELANNKNDALVNSYTKNLNLLKSKPDWTEHNQSALQAFNKREIDGISLSDRVWKLKEQAQMELEVHVGYGLLNGDSAATISRRIRQYLDDPTALFRRVRNEMGELEWSKAAKAYEPGQGKYRSAYKNARRLAVTETNMAYHTADHERWGSLGMVKGFRVLLSGSHPMDDICDTLKGEYPKEFKFTGWHPQCLCHAVPILMDAAEYDKYEEAILDGTEQQFLKGVKGVENVPEGFTKWISDNAERSKGWKGQPYFIRDNFKGGKIGGGLSLGNNGHVQGTMTGVETYIKGFSTTTVFNDKIVKEFITKFAVEFPHYFNGDLKSVRMSKSSSAFMSNTRYYDNKTGIRNIADGNVLTIHDYDFILKDGTTFNPAEQLKAALSAINKGDELSFNQEYSLESVWHEIQHAGSNGWGDMRKSSRSITRSMEVINQFTARHSYEGFIEKLGGVATHKADILSKGYGYSGDVENFRSVLAKYNISEDLTLRHFKDMIQKEPYENIQMQIIDYFTKNGVKDAAKVVEDLIENPAKFSALH